MSKDKDVKELANIVIGLTNEMNTLNSQMQQLHEMYTDLLVTIGDGLRFVDTLAVVDAHLQEMEAHEQRTDNPLHNNDPHRLHDD